MPNARELFREVLSRPACALAANIFDPLSARLAEMVGYEICVLSGSVGKSAHLTAPDLVVANMSDVVDHCRRITRVCDAPLLVDAEDGFGNAVNVARTVRELEAAGVAGIEIEDNFVPRRFNVPDPGLVSTAEQAGKLEAAVAARRDPATVIVARSAALGLCPLDEALERIRAYAQTGAEALMLTGAPTREQIAAVHEATSLPLCILSPPRETRQDQTFLDAHGVKILMLGNPVYNIVVQTIYDTLQHLWDGAPLEDIAAWMARPELLRALNRTDELAEWQERYLRE